MRKNINENSNIPVSIFLNKVKKIPLTIQKSVEFLFILKGELKVVINKQEFKLFESDVILINNGDVYEILGKKENLVLSMQIENEFFNDQVKREQSLFLCNSSINENEHYDKIRKILAKVMYEYSNRVMSLKLCRYYMI